MCDFMILSIASRNLRSSVADHAWREITGLVVLAFLVGVEVFDLELGVSLGVEGWSMGRLGGMIDCNENRYRVVILWEIKRLEKSLGIAIDYARLADDVDNRLSQSGCRRLDNAVNLETLRTEFRIWADEERGPSVGWWEGSGQPSTSSA
jgi:hypothetical protein